MLDMAQLVNGSACLQAVNVFANNSEKPVCLEEIPGFIKESKVKPKLGKENACFTQGHGSLEGKQVLAVANPEYIWGYHLLMLL